MLIAYLFGVSASTDAFFVAFRIPNFLRRLFAEGAFANAFVPMLTHYQLRSDVNELKLFIDKTAGALLLFLSVITFIGIIASPGVILLLAPGFSWHDLQYQISVESLQIAFPYVFFITLVAFVSSILNAYGKLVVPAFTPAILNICMIAAALWLAPLLDQSILALAWGVLIAGVLQLCFQLPFLLQLGLVPSFKLDWHDADVRRIISLMGPAIFSVSITQINLLLDNLIASFLHEGSVSWLYYSDRLVEFPLGIVGIAIATVILPNLSRHHALEDSVGFSIGLDWALRMVMLVGLPATIGLLMLAEPILSTFYQYHEFSVQDVHSAGQSLKAYAVGLLGFILIKVLVPAYTARGDMRTPVRFGIQALLISLGLDVLLVFPLAHAGLALATSLGAFANVLLLLLGLRNTASYRPLAGWWIFLFRLILAGAVMVVVLYYWVDADNWLHWEARQRILQLLASLLIGVVVYLLALGIFGLRISHLNRDLH